MSKLTSKTHRLGLVLPPDNEYPNSVEKFVLNLTITTRKKKQELLKYVDRMRDSIKDCIEQNYTNDDDESKNVVSEIDESKVLKWAAKNGRLDIMDLLLEKDIDGCKTDTGAAKKTLSDCTKDLQECTDTKSGQCTDKKSDKCTDTKSDSEGWDALLWAAKNGHVDIMKMLLDKGIKKDAQ